MINIVSFNGGRGAKTLISAFLKKRGIYYTSIVNAYDDGKSTGHIRSFFRMLGPSDIRKVQEALVPTDLKDYEAIRHLFNYRYDEKMSRVDILTQLEDYVQGRSRELAGLVINDETISTSLRTVIRFLLNGISLIEKSESKQINLDDCSIMNLIYAGTFLYCGGNFEEATVFIDKLFQLEGTVLPTNNEDKKLVAIREDGTILYSEAEIVELRSNSRIKKIYLLDQYPSREILSGMTIQEIENYFEIMNRQVSITPKVQHSISDADIIIYSAGTQHSSLYPSYITKGVTDAIAANKKALKVFITNIGEDYETPSYTASDFLNGTIKHLLRGSAYTVAVQDIISVALVNNQFANEKMNNYVKIDIKELEKTGCRIVTDGFEDLQNLGKHNGTMLVDFIINEYYSHLKNEL